MTTNILFGLIGAANLVLIAAILASRVKELPKTAKKKAKGIVFELEVIFNN